MSDTAKGGPSGPGNGAPADVGASGPPSLASFLGGPNGGGNGNGAARSFDRVPPHSLDAEVSVLGAALLSKNAATEVTEVLRPGDFYRSAHGAVFEAISDLMASGGAVDGVTVLDWLTRHGRLDEVGGPTAVHDLTASVPTAANAAHYARIVKEKSLLRSLIEAGTQVARMGYEASDDARTVVDQAESLIYQIAETGTTNEAAQLKDLLNESFELIEKLAENRSEVTGLPTGFNDLDRLTAGLQPQQLIIIAARPAMGKCLTSDSRIVTRSGATVALRDLVERGLAGKSVSVLAVDGDLRLRAREVSEFHDNGVRPVYRVRTRLGRSVTATANHPFLTPRGWTELDRLRPGTPLGTPRELPVFGQDALSEAEVKLLGLLIGDGCLAHGRAARLTSELPEIIAEAAEVAPAFGVRTEVTPKAGSSAVEVTFPNDLRRVTADEVAERAGVAVGTVHQARSGTGTATIPDATRARIEAASDDLHYTGRHERNHLQAWLEELGLSGKGSHDKFVPDPVFRLPRHQLALFLSRLYATDGSAWVAPDHGYFGISYTSVSERLARDVQHLLLRFGIIARLRERQVRYVDTEDVNTRRQAFEVEVRDAENVLRFLDEIGIFAKDEACARVRAAAEARTRAHTNTDLLPVEIWETVLAEKGDRSWADVSEATGRPRNHDWHVGERRPSRRLLAELAEALDSRILREWASSDLYWDEVVSVEYVGEEPVYDLTVPEVHNFVADDIVVHNSSLSLNLAQYVTAELRRPAILFSLEMSKLEIVNRLLASEARIDSQRIKTGRLEDADWRKLGDALGKLSEAPLFIDDTPSISLMEIRSKCRRIKQRHGLDLVIVDYLQLMQSHRRVDSRQQEVAEISRGLKMLAKELDVPVIALSQLSRQPESRTDKRPQLADLRESGSIEQDADIVGFIYRDEVYDEESPDRGIAELIISKHRNGATGTVKLAFLNHLTKFANLARAPAGARPTGPTAPPPDSPV
jgi:replicative DNA helicase